MSVNAPAYIGVGTDEIALANKIYSGVFNEAFRNMPKLFKKGYSVVHEKSDLEGAKSYQYLMFADTPPADVDYVPGGKRLGQNYAIDEGVVTRDNYIIADHWIRRDQMKTAQVGILSQLARADARQIGMEGDRRLFNMSGQAARAAAVTKEGLTVHSGGNRVARTGGSVVAAYPRNSTGAANYIADLQQLARQMDEDNIPRDNRLLWHTPYMEEVLLYGPATLFSRDYIGGENNVLKREVRMIAGFKIADVVNTQTNSGSLPDSNIVTGPAKFQANFAIGASDGTPVAIALTETADGGAPLSMGTWDSVQNIVFYDVTRMSWYVQSAILTGINYMNPWGAGSIEVIT